MGANRPDNKALIYSYGRVALCCIIPWCNTDFGSDAKHLQGKIPFIENW